MKKRLFYLFIFFLLFIPSDVYASNDVSISCDKTKLNINEETMCSLNLNNLNFVSTDVSGVLKVGNNLSIVDSSYDRNVWLSLDNTFNIFNINLIRHTNTMVNNLTIATFKIKANSNATGTSVIEFNNILVGNNDYESISFTCKPLNILFGNNVNTLSSLEVVGYNINFSSDKTSYSLSTDNDFITINANATDSKATINGTGNKKIYYGNNAFDILVIAENGLEKKYTINVLKNDNRSTINNLSKISLSYGKIKFDKNINEYTVNVDNSIDNIKISYELEDEKSSAEIIGDTNLSVGENIFVIKVTAENGNIKEYKITVTREDKEPIIKEFYINIKGYNIEFDKNNFEYIITSDDKILDIEVGTNEDIIKYDILGNSDLKNNSVVWVIAYDKNESNYKYKFIINNPEKETTNNATLKVLLAISVLTNIIIAIIFIVKRKKLNNIKIFD